MMSKLSRFINKKFPAASNFLMQSWYGYVSKVDKKGESVFLNYGYAGRKIKLKKKEERSRFQAQLYGHVASKISLKGKELLEIGCGRGGGASYIARYLKPKSIIGLDLCRKSIEFCKKHHSSGNLSFKEGDAARLPFKKESFDAVINVESSHGYPDFDKFLCEAYRVLRKKGFLLFADFRYRKDIAGLERAIKNSGFKIISKDIITEGVIKALKRDHKRKVALIKKFFPAIFHNYAKHFAGAEGSELYNSFLKREREYFCFILKKGLAFSSKQ